MPTAPESRGARGVALSDLLRTLDDLASVLVERESEPIVLVVLESSVERALNCLAVMPNKVHSWGWSALGRSAREEIEHEPTYLLAREPAVMFAWAAALASAEVFVAVLGVWRGGGIAPSEGVSRPEVDGVARPLIEGVARPLMEGVARPLSRTELRDEATESGRGTLPSSPTVGGSRRE